MFWKNLKFILIQLFVFFFVIIEGKRKKTRTGDIRNRTKSFKEFFLIILITILVLLLPLIITFIYKIINDPATPGVVNYYWNVFKSNGFGYLGTKETIQGNKKKVMKSN